MYDSHIRGPFDVWVLDYFTKEPKAVNLYYLDNAWFEYNGNSYEHYIHMVYMCEQNAIEAAIAINKNKMNNEIKIKQDNIRGLLDRLEGLNNPTQCQENHSS